ncbi:MAG: D-2-hydroxyacid dehydrogenase [Rhodospirillales bacterium]|jgi:phosphoglycerate dehydrogenase-like enzyme|nr:D-2-hydroxyacid dehydrogenase [Rhodospirillales bacterium]
MQEKAAPLNIFISTPLEPEQVEKIRAVAPDDVEVLFDPDLFPPLRYVADHKGVEGFQRTPEQDRRWRDYLGRADVLWDFAPKDADGTGGMDLAPNVKWAQTTSSGVGQQVKNLGFQDSDLLVTTAKGVHAGPLSEFFLLAVLIHFKRLAHLKNEQAAHHWERYCGEDLAGKTLAIVGVGAVGRRVAETARFLGMRTIATDVVVSASQASEMGFDEFFPIEQLHEMLGEADVLVLSVPHTPETDKMIDAGAFNALKDGAVLVNIARGQVVDELALIAALRSGKIAFAGLDVFEVEPLPPESPLWDMPNVLVSPHSASTVNSENAKITDIFCHNIRCYLDGRLDDMRNVLDKARMF